MAWRVARSLDTLCHQIDECWPRRSRASDGSIGDAAHATRNSDHNPWLVIGGKGVVTARDFTHDPDCGFDAHAFAERLRLSRDPRIKYVISDRRLFSSTLRPWEWRPYNGTNPHDKHTHVSVVADRRCDDTRPWVGVEPPPDLGDDDEMPKQEYVFARNDQNAKDGRPAGWALRVGARTCRGFNGAPDIPISGEIFDWGKYPGTGDVWLTTEVDGPHGLEIHTYNLTTST